MAKSTVALALMAVLLIPPSANAADKIGTSLTTNEVEEVVTTNVSFDYLDCEEECHVASLSCDRHGTVELDLADVVTDAVVKVMPLNSRQIILKAADVEFDFHIQKLEFAELTGAWWITAPLFGEIGKSLTESLLKAQTFTVSVATETRTLTVDKNVIDWAKGCL